MITISAIKELCKLIYPFRLKMLLVSVVGACTILCSVGLLGVSAVLIAKASVVNDMLSLMMLVALVRFFGIFRAVFRYVERLLSHIITLDILAKLRSDYYKKLVPLMPSAVGNKASKIFKNIISDIDILQFFYLKVVAVPLVYVIVLVVVGIFLYNLVPQVAFILLAAFLLEGIVLPLLVCAWQNKNAKQTEALQNEFYKKANDFLLGFDAIFFYKQDGLKEIEKCRKDVENSKDRTKKTEDWLNFVNQTIGAGVLLLSLYYASVYVNVGLLAGTSLVMVPLVAYSAMEAVSLMPLGVQFLFESMVATNDMQEVLKNKVGGREEICKNVLWQKSGIEFKNICFGYDDNLVLDDVSFKINNGEKVAIIGSIGSGKSSIINLLVGFYKQNSGSIVIDGVNIEQLNIEKLGEHMAILRQDSAIFCASIKENLQYVGDFSDDELAEVLKKANLWDYVNNLPDKLDYVLDEGGKNLSLGQRRRLMLAQVFLQDKPIILLDEALESLDSENRENILAQILDYAKNKTLVYITHDLSVIDSFDRVIELKNGKVK